MPAIPITKAPPAAQNSSENQSQNVNPLPTLLQTPSGLALLEIQGSLNSTLQTDPGATFPIGKLHFPLYDPANSEDGGSGWQKRVHLYVGNNQRLTGEVKKLAAPVAVLRRKGGEGEGEGDALEVVEIVYQKVLFAHRPEPVGTTSTD